MRNVATTAHALARALVAADLFILPCMTAAAEARPLWPSLDAQLRQSHIEPGSELERFVRDNQDFSILRPAEARTRSSTTRRRTRPADIRGSSRMSFSG